MYNMLKLCGMWIAEINFLVLPITKDDLTLHKTTLEHVL